MTKTADCSQVWFLINEVEKYDKDLFKSLSDAFCNFECSWSEHATEYHTDELKTDS
jgi:hypothetical protein